MHVRAVAAVTLTIVITPEDREAIERALVELDTVSHSELSVASRQTIGVIGDALSMSHGDHTWEL